MLLALLSIFSCQSTAPEVVEPVPTQPEAPARLPIRIGWQTTWATQGQLAVILMKTDILRSAGFEPEFVGFSYGGPLNEGALAGEVDVAEGLDQALVDITYDAETSGGLLIVLAEEDSPRLEDELAKRDVPVHRVGEVVERASDSYIQLR